jgi:hypothetical protein
MKKENALPILSDLNKVINGSQKIIKAIDNLDKNINYEKTFKACMINNRLLATNLKKIVTHLVDNASSFDPNLFNQMFGTKK